MLERWARAHERLFMTFFVTFVLAGAAAGAVQEAMSGRTVVVVVVWLAAFAVTATVMLVRHRSGRLILRRARDRRRQAAVNATGRGWSPLIVGSALAVLAVGGLSRGVLAAAVGGVFTAIGPVLLWIAFVLRPDHHRHEDL